MSKEPPTSFEDIQVFSSSSKQDQLDKLPNPLYEHKNLSFNEHNIVKKHPFHLVDPSPWPFVSSMAALVAAIGGVLAMHKIDHWLFFAGICFLIFTFFSWWRDVIKESNKEGIHTDAVQRGLKIGMGLFIASEIMFFFAFFWGYFYVSWSPNEVMGGTWPPKNIVSIDPFELPYLNTLLLLLSGTTVTWAHHALTHSHFKDTSKALGITVLLGLIFTCIQGVEYFHAPFHFKDGIYPSTFYMATGFHGVHVIIGTIFLAVCWFRNRKNHFTSTHHVGFEAAAWYWHFVDVVWLFLFVAIYWSGYKVVP